jgi:uncharacterized radical SAM protein YgiQ
MFGFECDRKAQKGACPEKGCLFPNICKQLPVNHRPQLRLLEQLELLPGVRKVFVGSGLRYDLILNDNHSGPRYLETLLRNHVSGQLKIAPEHTEKEILDLMGKPDKKSLREFLSLFRRTRKKIPQAAFLTYYLMAAYPGCTMGHMEKLRAFALKNLRLLPEQVQIFTPTPATQATLMYHTRVDPRSGGKLFVERNPQKKQQQKGVLGKRKKMRSKSR